MVEQLSDPRLTEVVSSSQPSPPTKPSSRIRLSFEQRTKRAQPISYAGEGLWAKRQAEAEEELNQLNSSLRYQKEYGFREE